MINLNRHQKHLNRLQNQLLAASDDDRGRLQAMINACKNTIERLKEFVNDDGKVDDLDISDLPTRGKKRDLKKAKSRGTLTERLKKRFPNRNNTKQK